MKNIVSFSGGKDSTAMLLRLIEEGCRVDEIQFCDLGWEFPGMIDHVRKVEGFIGRPIEIIKPERSIKYHMFEKPIVARFGPLKGTVHRIGEGWPHAKRRWCSLLKIVTMNRFTQGRYGKDVVRIVGISASEKFRLKRPFYANANFLMPLVTEWNMTSEQCLAYCYDRGFDWDGLYGIFNHSSCFCCPLMDMRALFSLWFLYPELWTKMLEMDDKMIRKNVKFCGDFSVTDLDRRFKGEMENSKISRARMKLLRKRAMKRRGREGGEG